MIRYSMTILLLLTLISGCAQETPLSRRNHDFALRDFELEREKYRTFVGSKERDAIDRQIQDHYTDQKKFNLLDEIRLGKGSEEKPTPTITAEDTARTKQLNDLINKQLHR